MFRFARTTKPLHIAMSWLMIILVALFYAGLASISLYMGYENDLKTANDIVQHISRELNGVFNAETRPIESAVVVLSETPLLTAKSHTERLAQINAMAAVLNKNQSATSVYAATKNGSFLMLRKLNTPADRATFTPPESAEFLMQSVNRDQGTAIGKFYFYDADLRLISTVDKPEYQFDPRTRPWYEQAMQVRYSGNAIETAPYIFASNQKIGITLATRNVNSAGVIGMDITLGALSRLVAKQQVTPSAELVVFNEAGNVLAYRDIKKVFKINQAGKREVVSVPELGVPAISEMFKGWKKQTRDDYAKAEIDYQMQVDGQEWYYRVEKMRDSGGQVLYLGVSAPKAELMKNSIRIRNLTFWASLVFMALMLPAVFFASKAVSRPIRELVKEANAIEHFDFTAPDQPHSKIAEVDDLGRAMDRMKHTLKRFLDISSALSAESNFHRLINIILREMISVTGATSGSLVLLSPDGKSVQPAARQLNGEIQDISTASSHALADVDTAPLEVKAVAEGKLQSVRISSSDPVYKIAYAKLFAALQVDQVHIIALPLRNRTSEVIGALTLSLKAPADERAEPISAALLAFIEALSGTAAIAIDNQKLVLDQKILFESIIKLVAGSIDAKSAYSGGHCQRVPELTKILARAACAQTEGPFADYSMTDDDWEALHIAGWLHDCGKLTTPEFVVDKSTKLETVYDRIHEVRMRFEVLKRDVEINALRKALAKLPPGLIDEEALNVEMQQSLTALDQDFSFVASCNAGGEFMAPDKIERLKAIAQRRWLRTLDNRLGISQEELMRKAGIPAEPLPAWENAISDKPEHIFPRPERESFDANNAWGFQLAVPDHLYNRGELYNLSVGRGTLTEEDRYKINEHIVQTIKMLDELPFPKHLRRVPEIAGSHHEKMDGTGYPRGQQQKEMSIEARMLAIADVFEALTAVDRPYKPGKTLSEAVKIMTFMARDRHIDAELFKLFLESGAYLEYAKKFMLPTQIDTVDVAAYVAA